MGLTACSITTMPPYENYPEACTRRGPVTDTVLGVGLAGLASISIGNCSEDGSREGCSQVGMAYGYLGVGVVFAVAATMGWYKYASCRSDRAEQKR
jgi:hypothetical protein